MADMNTMDEAAAAVAEILRLARISRVVFVDDIFEDRRDPELAIGLYMRAYDAHPDETRSLAPQVRFGDPDEVVRGDLREWWTSLDSAARVRNEQQVRLVVDENVGLETSRTVADLRAAGTLKDRFSGVQAYQELTPDQWLEEENSILANASPDKRLLCLFDQRLQELAPASDDGSQSGIGLIKKALLTGAGKSGSILCVLLTHTIPEIADEMAAWRTLAENNGLQLHSFLPLAKQRLQEDQAPFAFVDGLRKALLNSPCEIIKQSAIAILADAHAHAANELLLLDVYEFDRMILSSSRREGIWEIETLLRVYGIMHRDETWRQAMAADGAQLFNEAIALAHSIRDLDASSCPVPDSTRMRRLRHQELYQNDELVIHTPLQTGDFFEHAGTKTVFVLLAQPCDLAVRSDGSRSLTRGLVPLVPIRSRLTSQEETEKGWQFWRTRAALRSFYLPDSDDVGIVKFAEAAWVDVDVLDMAVLSADGCCRIDLSATANTPPQLTCGWRLRLKAVVKRFQSEQSRLESIKAVLPTLQDAKVRSSIWESALPPVSFGRLNLRLNAYHDNIFDFGLRRCRRYRRPQADTLLHSFARYLSRDADEHDFST